MNRRTLLAGVAVVVPSGISGCIGDDGDDGDDADDATDIAGEVHEITADEAVAISDPPEDWVETEAEDGHREYRDDHETVRVQIDAEVFDALERAADRYDEIVGDVTDDGTHETESVDEGDEAVSVTPSDDEAVIVMRSGNVVWTIWADILWFPPDEFPDTVARDFAERVAALV